MNDSPSSPFAYRWTVLLGIVAGMRTTLPWAMLAWSAQDGREGALPGFLTLGLGRGLLTAAAIGEMIGDKLPFVPSRLSPAPLVGRVVSGALGGAAIGRQARLSPVAGAAGGAVGAAGGALAGYGGRTYLARWLKVPFWLSGVAEDALAVWLGRAAAGGRRQG